MRKVILTVLGLFTISNAETVIATGTLSIEEMKRMIIKLKQENELQSAKISYLERKVANLEKKLSGFKGKSANVDKKLEKGFATMGQTLGAVKPKAYCVIANLNVRKGPGLNHEVIAWLRKGAVVSGTIKKGKWLKILSPSGWVSSLYLRECSNGRKEK